MSANPDQIPTEKERQRDAANMTIDQPWFVENERNDMDLVLLEGGRNREAGIEQSNLPPASLALPRKWEPCS